MNYLNHHHWIQQSGFRRFKCATCDCERNWDSSTQRYIYSSHGKSYYMAPDCKSTYTSDPGMLINQLIQSQKERA